MFNFSRSLILTLLTLALSSALTLAAPHKGKHHNGSGVTKKLTGVAMDAIERRYDNARFTYYDAGQNACGGTDSNTDYVSAAWLTPVPSGVLTKIYHRLLPSVLRYAGPGLAVWEVADSQQ